MCLYGISRIGQEIRQLFCTQKIRGLNPLSGNFLQLIKIYRIIHNICSVYIHCPNIYKRVSRALIIFQCKSAVVKDYPYPVCISINSEVCHGNIFNKKLSDNDVINIDVCLNYMGELIDGCRSYTLKDRILTPNTTYIKYNHELYKSAKKNWGSIISNIKYKHWLAGE